MEEKALRVTQLARPKHDANKPTHDERVERYFGENDGDKRQNTGRKLISRAKKVKAWKIRREPINAVITAKRCGRTISTSVLRHLSSTNDEALCPSYTPEVLRKNIYPTQSLPER